jgi:hypothetical protein
MTDDIKHPAQILAEGAHVETAAGAALGALSGNQGVCRMLIKMPWRQTKMEFILRQRRYYAIFGWGYREERDAELRMRMAERLLSSRQLGRHRNWIASSDTPLAPKITWHALESQHPNKRPNGTDGSRHALTACGRWQNA